VPYNAIVRTKKEKRRDPRESRTELGGNEILLGTRRREKKRENTWTRVSARRSRLSRSPAGQRQINKGKRVCCCVMQDDDTCVARFFLMTADAEGQI
jgi:hypothetical protein